MMNRNLFLWSCLAIGLLSGAAFGQTDPTGSWLGHLKIIPPPNLTVEQKKTMMASSSMATKFAIHLSLKPDHTYAIEIDRPGSHGTMIKGSVANGHWVLIRGRVGLKGRHNSLQFMDWDPKGRTLKQTSGMGESKAVITYVSQT